MTRVYKRNDSHSVNKQIILINCLRERKHIFGGLATIDTQIMIYHHLILMYIYLQIKGYKSKFIVICCGYWDGSFDYSNIYLYVG